MYEKILKTLAYADIFNYPLNFRELYQFLISTSPPSFSLFNKALLKINTKNGFYFLKGREKVIKIRKERESWSKEKWFIAKNTADKLKIIPSIKMIGASGALAMNNCKRDDDIDLIIITSKDSLWLTRSLIIILCLFLGIKRRRRGERKINNKVCLNLFLEEDHLKIEPENLFLAHEICQVKPILDKNNTYKRFIEENKWVKKYLSNAVKFGYQPPITNNSKSMLSFFNLLAFKIQLWYMKPKITIEKISQYQAFFHPNNLNEKIMKEYKQKLALLGLDKR